MSEEEKSKQQKRETNLGRRSFLYTAFGGALAAIAGWMAGIFPRGANIEPEPQESGVNSLEDRISALQAQVATLEGQLMTRCGCQDLAQLEGENNERIIFNKSELSVINPDGVLLNLVATHGHVGIRFYKDFDFGNEQVTGPWHMGYIEGIEGYQGLAILRDWQFTAALWNEDGKLMLGRLHPHPPANAPAKARLHITGNSTPDDGPVDEVLTIVEASPIQSVDIFQVIGSDGKIYFAVDGTGRTHIGSHDNPKEIVLHDKMNGRAYSLGVTNGSLVLTEA
jgi:hypothetical protein